MSSSLDANSMQIPQSAVNAIYATVALIGTALLLIILTFIINLKKFRDHIQSELRKDLRLDSERRGVLPVGGRSTSTIGNQSRREQGPWLRTTIEFLKVVTEVSEKFQLELKSEGCTLTDEEEQKLQDQVVAVLLKEGRVLSESLPFNVCHPSRQEQEQPYAHGPLGV